jgi:hypothetical protein
MFSTFAEFAVILAVATAILLVALTFATRGRSILVTKASGPYWDIRNQSDSGTIVISKFVNKSKYQVEWSYSAKLFFDIAPERSAEANIVLEPGERATIALFSSNAVNLKAVPQKSIAKRFDLVAKNPG